MTQPKNTQNEEKHDSCCPCYSPYGGITFCPKDCPGCECKHKLTPTAIGPEENLWITCHRGNRKIIDDGFPCDWCAEDDDDYEPTAIPEQEAKSGWIDVTERLKYAEEFLRDVDRTYWRIQRVLYDTEKQEWDRIRYFLGLFQPLPAPPEVKR